MRCRRRSRSEILLIVARSTGLISRLPPVPASAMRTPIPSPHAIRLQGVSCEQGRPAQHSSRTSPARTPAGSMGWWCSGSPRVGARSSRARRPRRGASEGQGPVDRDLAGMKPEAESTRTQGPPESQLGLRVLPPYSRHHPGTGLLVHDIGHLRRGFPPLGRTSQGLLGQHQQALHHRRDRQHPNRRGDRCGGGRRGRHHRPGAPDRELLMTAFAAAVGALFADPNISREAVFIADGGARMRSATRPTFLVSTIPPSARQAAHAA